MLRPHRVVLKSVKEYQVDDIIARLNALNERLQVLMVRL
jgi:hypothetical protein